jgi:hypothetical protein
MHSSLLSQLFTINLPSQVFVLVDIGGRSGGSHLFLVNQKQTQYIDTANQELPYSHQVVDDVLNRTETAMSQAHSFLATELMLRAQEGAQRLTPRS